MRTISTHTFLLALALAVVCLPFTVVAQEIDSPEEFYPLEVGNLWQHSMTYTGIWPDSVVVTAEVVGEILMPNGHVYKHIQHRADSTESGCRSGALAAYGTYQRVDTATAIVYSYNPGSGREYAQLWLNIAPDLDPPPDSTADPYVFRFDTVEQQYILGQERAVLVGDKRGGSDAQPDRDVLLARGIGTVQNDLFGAAPLIWQYVRLLYARINGREYGEMVATSVIDKTELPSKVELQENYPNPFSISTTIPFEVPSVGPVSLVVYDLLGREITVLFDGVISPGNHKMVWRPRDVPSGLYLCELVVGSTRKSRLLLYLK